MENVIELVLDICEWYELNVREVRVTGHRFLKIYKEYVGLVAIVHQNEKGEVTVEMRDGFKVIKRWPVYFHMTKAREQRLWLLRDCLRW